MRPLDPDPLTLPDMALVAPLPTSLEEALAWFGYLDATDVRNALLGVLVVVIVALALVGLLAVLGRAAGSRRG